MDTKKTFKQRLAQMKEDFSLFSSKTEEKRNLFDFNKVEVEEVYNYTTHVNTLFQQLETLQHHEENLQQELKELKDKKEAYERYTQLSQEEKEEIEKIWVTIEKAELERESLKNQFVDSSSINPKLQQFEKDIPLLLKEIETMEENQRKAKKDIDYLEGEKGALYFTKEKLEQVLVTSQKTSIAVVMGLAFLSLLLVLLHSVYDFSIVVFGSILAVIGLFIGTWLYILQRRVRFEIQKNIRMQNRAVELLNKAKLRYVHYTRFLQYEYEKFGVQNLHMLQYQWNLYCERQTHKNQYQRVASQKSQLELELWDFIEKIFVGKEELLDQEIAFLFDPNRREDRVHELMMQYKKAKQQWMELQQEKSQVQKELQLLQEQQDGIQELPHKLLDKYLQEMKDIK